MPFWSISRVVHNLVWSASSKATKRNGCKQPDSVPPLAERSSAIPQTIPCAVSNATSTKSPCSRAFDKSNNPPLVERSQSFPVTA